MPLFNEYIGFVITYIYNLETQRFRFCKKKRIFIYKKKTLAINPVSPRGGRAHLCRVIHVLGNNSRICCARN